MSKMMENCCQACVVTLLNNTFPSAERIMRLALKHIMISEEMSSRMYAGGPIKTGFNIYTN